MQAEDKILKALEATVNHLKNAVQALKREDEKSFDDATWHAAAELEYALFLFSIMLKDAGETQKLKVNPESKVVNFEAILIQTQDFLSKAGTCMANKNILEAYKNANVARHYLLKVQEELAKRKRMASKTK
ncbi:MAG: hypothetical protein QXZ25_02905 [Candidatus Bathyarchaeia archaeon]